MHILDNFGLFGGFVGLIFLLYMTYYLLTAVNRPVFICKNEKLRTFMTTNMPTLSERFWPTVWCFSGRLQTIAQGILNTMNIVSVDYRREMVHTPDGGEIAIDWADNDDGSPYETSERPIVIIIPGLAGSSEEDYIKRMVIAALELGYRVVVFNNRGLGQTKLKTPRTFAMTKSEDTRLVISHIRASYPRVPLIAEGFSAGAITLFHYLSHYGEDSHLQAAMLNSVLFEAFETTRSIESFFNLHLLNRLLTKALVQLVVLPNLDILSQNTDLDISSILQARTAREYHTRLTTPMFGYEDWKEFYKECCTAGKMHMVKIPMLILNAADDPFAPKQSIPIEEIKQQENVMLALMSHGGHNAFLTGFLPTGRSFDVEVFSQFVSTIFRNNLPIINNNKEIKINNNR
ncbi:phospholipase ABHD3-like [Amphiura filiformis]|uniref:phospholipase ABHD3-like n=1 Tax=Amphiura filiformis TaxID=82378 RepID=UPI003B2116AC